MTRRSLTDHITPARQEQSADWRAYLAGLIRSMSDCDEWRRARHVDQLVNRILRFLRRPAELPTRDPDLLQVWNIQHEQPLIRSMIQALLLGGASDQQVAIATDIPVPVVALYHDVHFDVRGRSAGWIETRVLQRPPPDGDAESHKGFFTCDGRGRKTAMPVTHLHWQRLSWMLGADLFLSLLQGTVTEPEHMLKVVQVAQQIVAQERFRQLLEKTSTPVPAKPPLPYLGHAANTAGHLPENPETL